MSKTKSIYLFLDRRPWSNALIHDSPLQIRHQQYANILEELLLDNKLIQIPYSWGHMMPQSIHLVRIACMCRTSTQNQLLSGSEAAEKIIGVSFLVCRQISPESWLQNISWGEIPLLLNAGPEISNEVWLNWNRKLFSLISSALLKLFVLSNKCHD